MSIVIRKHIAERFMDFAIYAKTFKFSRRKKEDNVIWKEVFDELVEWFDKQPELKENNDR